ncbi:putative beta-lysine N-acetyltransferase [uncultured Bacteroides sp.]|uniref:putative beta-lysine N-acetyltransferase n=1 Tax=uncultured Bacteroides sp. TaxID=162156 RepID=UPI002AA72F28|nr:putative beta-lysine N-acetyltransferase [uncultured Bacteroides sp.]
MVNMKMTLKSHLSHDKENDRVYLMEMHADDFPQIILYMDKLARTKKYTKVFAKVPVKYGPAFLNSEYRIEASIPCFYDGQEDALFLAKYFSEERKQPDKDALNAFSLLLLEPASTNALAPLDQDYKLRPLKESDAVSMASLFKKVFISYPFPVFDPAFIIKSIKEDGTRYFGIFHDEKLVAVSSAECSQKGKNAEMTDFAVFPTHRGKKLATHLLAFMEEELSNDGYQTFYTIARICSLAMNKTFYDRGYKYSGTLTQNTQISGKIESMNVWYKRI